MAESDFHTPELNNLISVTFYTAGLDFSQQTHTKTQCLNILFRQELKVKKNPSQALFLLN